MAQRTAGDLQHAEKNRSTIRALRPRACRWRSTAGAPPRCSRAFLDHAFMSAAFLAAGLRPSAAREEDLVKIALALVATLAPRGPRRSASSPKRASPTSRSGWSIRTLTNLYLPAGVFVIDQWRQIGCRGRARAGERLALQTTP